MSPRAPHRFYFAGHIRSQQSDRITLSPEESHHLLHVLRLHPGTFIDLFDASGSAWSARVTGQQADRACVQLLEELEIKSASQTPLNMGVAVLKRRAMDWMIEKLSELDVECLQPLRAARCVVQPSISPQEDTPERWERLTIAAAKQCGRARPMTILPPVPLDQWLNRPRPPCHAVYAHSESSTRSLGQWLAESSPVALPLWIAIGPEGGWTPDEQESFEQAGFKPVALGPLVLRAETAAIATAAACRLMDFQSLIS